MKGEQLVLHVDAGSPGRSEMVTELLDDLAVARGCTVIAGAAGHATGGPRDAGALTGSGDKRDRWNI